jgi:hypothetical protein
MCVGRVNRQRQGGFSHRVSQQRGFVESLLGGREGCCQGPEGGRYGGQKLPVKINVAQESL